MQPVGGLQLLKTLRSGGAGVRPDLPVVLFAAEADLGLIGIALALDVDGFVAKPVAKPVLLARLRRSLAQPPARVAAAACGAVEIPADAGRGGAPAHAVGAGTRPSGPEQLVALTQAQEGQRLSRDLVMRNGVRLVGAGSPLSRRTIDRLHDLIELDPSLGHVWVSI